MGELLFLMFIGIPYIVYRFLADEEGSGKALLHVITGFIILLCIVTWATGQPIGLLFFVPVLIFTIFLCIRHPDDGESDLDRINTAILAENCTISHNEQTKYSGVIFLTAALKNQYPFGGLENAITACTSDKGVLVNRATGERYVTMRNHQKLDKERCIKMIMQDRVWAMRQFADFSQYLSAPIEKIPFPDIDQESAAQLQRDAVIRYILMKNNWNDEYIRDYMRESQIYQHATSEYFDRYFEDVKLFLDKYPCEHFSVTETV